MLLLSLRMAHFMRTPSLTHWYFLGRSGRASLLTRTRKRTKPMTHLRVNVTKEEAPPSRARGGRDAG